MSTQEHPGRPQQTVDRALAAARCDDCVVIADETSTANLRWAGNTLTTNGVARFRRLTVIAITRGADGARAGVVSRAGVTAAQVAEVVGEAERAAAGASLAEDAQPLAAPGQSSPAASARAWDEPPTETDIGVLRAFADSLGAAFAGAQTAGHRLYGFAEHVVTSTFLGTSTGLRLRHDQPAGRLELNAKSADMSRSAWDGAATRDFADVDVISMADGLGTRLDWAARQVTLAPGRYETLLPPTAVADLMVDMYWSAGCKDALDGRTFFSRPGGRTRVGERLTGVPLTLRGSPDEPGLECAPFHLVHASSREASVFDNGIALRPTEWISGGRLAALTQTRYSARLSGLAVTPPIDNLILEADGASASTEQMIARTRRGLLLTCLWYIREVDPQALLLTGLTRDGVYLVENGEVTAAVNNFRFNESPIDMLRRISEVGATTRTLPREWSDDFTRAAMPTLRVDGFNMSSASQAS